MEALSILRAARGVLAKPEDWRQGMQRGVTSCCAAEAIERVSNPGTERSRAYRALANAAGVETIIGWNDAPERTHADVMVAFNLAIATLRLC